MQVLLRNKIDKLGDRGDIVTVKDGYARNYLLPKGLAVAVNEGDKKSIESERRRLVKVLAKERMEVAALSERISQAALVIASKANEEGHLFGSVGPKDIAEELAKSGVAVEESDIRLDAHIKALGEYEVPIHLSGDVNAIVKVTVVGE